MLMDDFKFKRHWCLEKKEKLVSTHRQQTGESGAVSWGINATVASGHDIFLRGTTPHRGATTAMAFMASLKFLP